jgi:hypothetical protein
MMEHIHIKSELGVAPADAAAPEIVLLAGASVLLLFTITRHPIQEDVHIKRKSIKWNSSEQ